MWLKIKSSHCILLATACGAEAGVSYGRVGGNYESSSLSSVLVWIIEAVTSDYPIACGGRQAQASPAIIAEFDHISVSGWCRPPD